MSNADSRQAIFFRARLVEPGYEAPDAAPRQGFVVQMIDNGFVFDGPNWRFGESAVQGLYHRPDVYSRIEGLAGFEPWIERIMHFPEEVVDAALRSMPAAWIDGEERHLEDLLAALLRRRDRVPELIESCREARSSPFPAWQA